MHWNAPLTLPVHFLLPDCAYSSAAVLLGFTLPNVIVVGSAEYPDPIVRLKTSPTFASLRAITLQIGSFYNADGTPYQWDLSAFFTSFPALNSISAVLVNMNCPLPASLPSGIAVVILSRVGLTGSIPSTLLSGRASATQLTLNLDSNSLEGSIPPTLLDDIPLNNVVFTYLSISLSGNRLEGSIPNTLFGGRVLASVATIFLDVSNNMLTGSPGAWMESGQFLNGVLQRFTILLSGNRLSGPISSNWFPAAFSATSYWMWNMDKNQISGSIPSDLFAAARFPAALTAVTSNLFVFSASHNKITGSVPASLLTLGAGPTASAATSMASYAQFSVVLRNNTLDGTIDSDLFRYMNWTMSVFTTVDLSVNSLTGDLPLNLFGAIPPINLRTLVFNVSYNALDGTLPTTFLQSINPGSGLYPMPTFTGTYSTRVFLDLDSSGLTGALNVPSFAARTNCQPINITLTAADNNLEQFNIANNLTTGLFAFNISNNLNAAGVLPSDFFATTSQLSILKAASTSAYGTMPFEVSNTLMKLTQLILDDTFINFCPPPARPFWSGIQPTLAICSFLQTNASMCTINYPTACASSAPVREVPVPPVSPPTTPPFSPTPISPPTTPIEPVSPPITPTSPPTTPPTTPPITPPVTPPITPPVVPHCAESTRPGPSFTCINGSWTAPTVTTPVFTIPSGATQTVVQGNLTSSQVIIRGIGSTLVVVGCSSNLTSLTIELTPEDLEKIGKTKTQPLLSADPSCTNLSAVQVSATVKGSSCRKLSTSKSVSGSGMLLSGVFTVDSSGCNKWWIILVSVICAVVVVAVAVILIVYFVCCGSKSMEYYKAKG